MNHQILPSNVSAEKTVLGAVLVDNAAFDSAIEELALDDFYLDSHRRIWLAFCSLAEKSTPMDLVTVKAEMEKTKSLESAGGIAYLAGLVEGVPRLENVKPWCRIIRDASVRRRVIQASSQMAMEAVDSEDSSEDVLDRAEQAIFAIADQRIRAGLYPVQDFIKKTFEQIEKAHEAKGAVTGVPSGFSDLDRLTSGFQPTDLIILAARPAMGKTSIALNIVRKAAEKVPVAVFSMEMSKEQLLQRLIFAEARVDSSLVRRGQLREQDWSRLAAAYSTISKLPISIDEASSQTPLELRAKCRRLKSSHGIGLVVVDYLQLMSSGMKSENRQNEVAAISRSLKALAKEMKIPVLALSQLSRDLEKREDKRPHLSDLRESGSLEQEADIVAFLYRECVYNPTPENQATAELIISKHRNGPIDVVPLSFLREFTRFENAAIDAFVPTSWADRD